MNKFKYGVGLLLSLLLTSNIAIACDSYKECHEQAWSDNWSWDKKTWLETRANGYLLKDILTELSKGDSSK